MKHQVELQRKIIQNLQQNLSNVSIELDQQNLIVSSLDRKHKSPVSGQFTGRKTKTSKASDLSQSRIQPKQSLSSKKVRN